MVSPSFILTSIHYYWKFMYKIESHLFYSFHFLKSNWTSKVYCVRLKPNEIHPFSYFKTFYYFEIKKNRKRNMFFDFSQTQSYLTTKLKLHKSDKLKLFIVSKLILLKISYKLLKYNWVWSNYIWLEKCLAFNVKILF